MKPDPCIVWQDVQTDEFFRMIECPEPIVAAVHAVDAAAGEAMIPTLGMYNEGDALFAEAVQALGEQIGFPAEQVVLALYARLLAGHTLPEFRRIGIPDAVFVETMTDFNRLAERGFKQYGYYSVPAQIYRGWFRHNINLTLFTLGRLQFEPRSYDGPDDELCKAGDTVIGVHIPARGELSEENCEAAYEEARVFFRRYFGMEKVVFRCSSWLMDPQWAELLGESSRICAFQRHYRIVLTESNVPAAAYWIFGGYREDPREYPADTSLRRKAVELLLNGGTLNISLGIRE